jgi:urea transporter
VALRRREDAIPTRLTIGFVFDAWLHAYAEILFSRSRLVGALLIAATAFDLRLAIAGAVAVLLAALTALLLRFDGGSIREGFFGYNALLVALAGVASFELGRPSIVLLVVAVLGSVLVTGALRSALGLNFNLPPLSLPFVFVAHLLLGAAPMLGIEREPLAEAAGALGVSLPEPLSLYLRSLGAIFFLPREDAGALVCLALLVHSRIGVLLSFVGLGMAQLIGFQLVGVSASAMPVLLGFNFILTAVALGGVWFVPSIASVLFAAAGALLCGLILLGMQPILGAMGIPLLILPFNVTVILALYAMRQRVKDQAPKSVDFLLGAPEENLNYYRTRLARFGSRYMVRLSAPFRGRWVCTQGVDGPHTHRGQWNEALDFEVQGPEGKRHRGAGRVPKDYLCYRLPLLAPADGTVVRVVDGVPDNPIGEVNLQDNWGNLVIIHHAPLVYSMMAHLAPGSLKVQEGQIVRRGDLVGLCGNSGRSPYPHLHFQIQATSRIGAGTTPVELHDVVVDEGDGPKLRATHVPDEDGMLRNIDAQPELKMPFRFQVDREVRFRISRNGRVRDEVITPEIDLYGNLLLRSDRDAVLFYERTDSLFTVYDVLGSPRSALRLIQAALARVPFERSEELEWSDYLPMSRYVLGPLHWLWDFAAPFVSWRGLRLSYRQRWTNGRLIVEGQSRNAGRSGSAVQTRAEIDREKGIQRIEVTLFGRRTIAERLTDTADEQPANRSNGRAAREETPDGQTN